MKLLCFRYEFWLAREAKIIASGFATARHLASELRFPDHDGRRLFLTTFAVSVETETGEWVRI